jgi:hypothetical protein
MSTLIRAEISKKNKYWISKHRHYELKHFCLQYPEWKKECTLRGCTKSYLSTIKTSIKNHKILYSPISDNSSLSNYLELIELVEQTAKEADQYLYDYIIKGVTEGRSYTYLKAVLGIPCGKDMYYDRYRKFFWLLSNARR